MASPDRPAASVVIPAYNAADFLVEQLDALARQKDAPEFEVLVFGHLATQSELARLGKVTWRERNGGPWITDAGNYLYDVNLGPIADPRSADAALRAIPGVVETGLFCGRAQRVLVAGDRGIVELEPPR